MTEESVSASPRENGEEAGDAGQTAGEIMPEQPGLMAGETKDGGTEDSSGGRTAKKRGAVAGSGLRSEWSESGEAPEGRTASAQPESLGRAENGQSVTTEKRGAVVSSGLRPERSESGEAPEGRTAFAESEDLGRVANRRSVTTGEITSEQPELMAGELWKVGPVWTARGGTSGPALEGAGRSGTARAGLEGLYRQTVRGLLPAAPALPLEQTGRTIRTQDPGSAASLAVDELDRAVRRDSRRYDGGMSIY